MWDLAGVYASMARALNHQTKNKGVLNAKDFHPPYYKIDAANKRVSTKNIPLDATSIWFTFQAMKEVMRPGQEGLWQQFASSQTIAWKTGTSFGFRDGMGHWNNTKKCSCSLGRQIQMEQAGPGLIGVQTAAPILFDIFRLLPVAGWFQKPLYNFSFVPVCRQSGYRANIDCTDVDTLFMPPNGVKVPLCQYHKMINLDRSGQYRVTEDCESPSAMLHKSLVCAFAGDGILL